MKLFTLIENQKKLEKAEIEIQMIAGIPQIHYLGLPDQAIKESFLRIKSALKLSGYKFPTNQQIIVNIKPNYLKKSSKGLELAVALGILHMTGQKTLQDSILKSIIYGELDLNGEVNEPADLIYYKRQDQAVILSGKDTFQRHQIELRIPQLNEDIEHVSRLDVVDPVRPTEGLDLLFSPDEAEILFLFSVSGLHLLLSGPSGFGKTTLAKNSLSFINSQRQKSWPQLVAPHASVTPAAFLGGGAQLYRGEIENVENGILFLDEFLEFDSEILESLRGPMTGQKLRLSRTGNVREFECNFQVIGTTNLCPCGKWTPAVKVRNCRFSNKKCKSHLEKLSGPVMDRFGLYYYYPQKLPERTVSGYDILKRIEKYEKIKGKFQSINRVNAEVLMNQMYSDISLRRKQALTKIACIYAVERESSILELPDLVQAEKWTYNSFLELENGMN